MEAAETEQCTPIATLPYFFRSSRSFAPVEAIDDELVSFESMEVLDKERKTARVLFYLGFCFWIWGFDFQFGQRRWFSIIIIIIKDAMGCKKEILTSLASFNNLLIIIIIRIRIIYFFNCKCLLNNMHNQNSIFIFWP